MKIVVTGGCGYIGSKVAANLISSEQHEVIIFDNYSTSVSDDILGCKSVRCDITNPDSIGAIKLDDVDMVLHLAAQSSGPKSIHQPDLDIDINIKGTLNILKWCIDNNVSKIIFASSFVVYGDVDGVVSESYPCCPKSIYANSKFCAENLIKIYGGHHGLQWNILRLFNVYGPGQDLTRMDQGMVSIFMKLIQENTHIDMQGSMSRFRDFIHVDDVVSGWRCCVENFIPNQVYNLGTGLKVELSTLIELLSKYMDKEVTVSEVSSTPGDILGCFADVSKLRNVGYKPRYDLALGLRHMLNSYGYEIPLEVV